MPKITRKQQKIFASNATNNGVFGSLQANDPTHSQDPDVIQGRTAYANGWDDATYSAEKLPPLEEFQALQYLFSRQIAYIMQEGVPEWDTSTTYYKGALVKALQSDGSFILYASLVDNNQGNLVTDTTKWVITNTSTNFHQGIPNWREDVIYSEGDWVKAYNSSTGWTIYESRSNSNLNNDVEDADYWAIKPFTSEFPLFTFSWFDHEVDDMSWLRADTFSWQDGTVYTNAYDHLVDDIDGVSTSTETIGSYTVTYYQATDGHKICLADQEATVANIYNESGVAWYYVLDTTNQRFKLPRTKYGFVGLRDTVGKYLPESLPSHKHTRGTMNITGTYGFGDRQTTSFNVTGAFYDAGYVSNTRDAEGKSADIPYLGFDASRSWTGSTSNPDNATYQANAPVQQRATQMYLYFYVGNFSQSATEQTAGLNSELFNGKLDLDAANLSTAGKSLISGLGMPSNTYIDLTPGASGTKYNIQANGYLCVGVTHPDNANWENIGIDVLDGNDVFLFNVGGTYYLNNQTWWFLVPVSKGFKVQIYSHNFNITRLRFIYAQGEENV